MKFLLLVLFVSCVTVPDENNEVVSGKRHECYRDLFSFLEEKSNRADVFSVQDRKVALSNENFGNLIVLRDENVVEVVVSQRDCKRDPKQCNQSEILPVTKPFTKQFAPGYIFKNSQSQRKFVSASFKLASSCLRQVGDVSSAKNLERELGKL